jgi:serine/threonine-protein kinase
MEYVDGPSMRQLLDDTFKDNRSIDITYVQKVLNYSAQICDALAAAHSEGIVHRDIKPDNVMSTKRGIVKITDFGILHHEEMAYTPTGAIIGTPRYMSPEQVQGGHIDGRSDIYAVGILLYEMLTSAPPFISGDIAFQQVNNSPPNPRAICPLINASLESVILSCLEKDADKRYQSAKILQEALLTELQAIGGTPPPSRNATGHRSTAELNRMTPFARPAVDANLEEDLDLD